MRVREVHTVVTRAAAQDSFTDTGEITCIEDAQALVEWLTREHPQERPYVEVATGRYQYFSLQELPDRVVPMLRRFKVYITVHISGDRVLCRLERGSKVLNLPSSSYKSRLDRARITVRQRMASLKYAAVVVREARAQIEQIQDEHKARRRSLKAEAIAEQVATWPEVLDVRIGPYTTPNGGKIAAGNLGILFMPVLFRDEAGGMIPSAPTWYILGGRDALCAISAEDTWSHPHINNRGELCLGSAEQQFNTLYRLNDVWGLLGVLRQMRLGWDNSSEYNNGWYKHGWQLWYNHPREDTPFPEWDGRTYQDSSSGEMVDIEAMLPDTIDPDLVLHVGVAHKIVYADSLVTVMEERARKREQEQADGAERAATVPTRCICGSKLRVGHPDCPYCYTPICLGSGYAPARCGSYLQNEEGEWVTEPPVGAVQIAFTREVPDREFRYYTLPLNAAFQSERCSWCRNTATHVILRQANRNNYIGLYARICDECIGRETQEVTEIATGGEAETVPAAPTVVDIIDCTCGRCRNYLAGITALRCHTCERDGHVRNIQRGEQL